MVDLSLVLAGTTAVSLVLGLLVAWFAERAARRTSSRPLHGLAAGIGLLALGTGTAWIATVLDSVRVRPATVVASGVVAAGFVLVAVSVFVSERR